MATPLISICIPAYKAEKYLEAALDSVRAQTFVDWELIVTEDGSKDRTEEIVQTFAHNVPQSVIYNRHEKNRGLPATRNTGIAAARGTWVAFLDSDDLWKPNHLADLIAAANDSVGLVYAGCEIFEDTTGQITEMRAPTKDALTAFPLSLYDGRIIIQPSAAMVRRAELDRIGGISERYPICNDMEFWLRAAFHGVRFAYTGDVTCRYRKHGAAMSLKSAALIAETARICEAYGDWSVVPRTLRRRRCASLYRDAARIMLRSEPRGARDCFQKSLRHKLWSPASAAGWLAASALTLSRSS